MLTFFLKTALVISLSTVVNGCTVSETQISQTPSPLNPSPEVLISGLEHPWGMAWLPDGSMLITERLGRLRRVRNGQLEPKSIEGLPEIFAQGQGGLLDIAVHPQFAQNRQIFFTYSHGNSNANHTRVARAVLNGYRLEQVQVIFQVSQLKSSGQHFGSRLLWLKDGTLLVSIGDGGNPPVSLDGQLIRLQAQNRRSQLGKILRINPDGSVPANNPFRDGDRRIFSYGHRNIQGLALDPNTGKVWASEHGARGGDELNLIQAGKNYGWPLVTHSREYFGPEISPDRSRPGMEDPKLVWEGTVAPSGLTVHQGKLYAGGLVSKDIKEIQVDSQGNVVSQRDIPIGQRVRDVRSHNGYLYVLTDAPNGQLLRFQP